MQEIEAICDRVISLKDGRINNDQYIQNIGSPKGQYIYLNLDSAIDIGLIEDIADIENVNLLEGTIFEIRGKAGVDIRPLLFDGIVAQGSRILEMRNMSNSISKHFDPSL